MTNENRTFSETSSGRGPRDGDRDSMKTVDHTHPHTDEAFGAAFKRGPTVAADGGESFDERRPHGGERDAESEDEEEQTMEDVDHEAPGEGVARAYERGTEGRDESV